jgi:DNA-binding response OmpR family regulator
MTPNNLRLIETAGPAERARVLIVEDCPDLGDVLPFHFRDAGYEVDLATGGRSGLQMARSGNYRIVILDLSLPEIDGLEICRSLRQTGAETSVLMLTARSSEIDRVLGLEMGADDYLTKPFSIRELLARVKAIIRRSQPDLYRSLLQEASTLKRGRLTVNTGERSTRIGDRAVDLTAKEFDLLLHFVRYPGHVFTRAQLLDRVWGYSHLGYEHTVNSHINRLRAKIEEDPRDPRFILTVWGVGYKFNPQAS